MSTSINKNGVWYADGSDINENLVSISNVANRSCTSLTYDETTAIWTGIAPVVSSDWGVGYYINNNNIKWDVNQTFIVSMDVLVPVSINWNADINNARQDGSGSGNDLDNTGLRKFYTDSVLTQTIANRTLTPNVWHRLWFSQTANATYSLRNANTNWGLITKNQTAPVTFYMKNIKGEVGTVPTPWIPNESDEIYISNTQGFNEGRQIASVSKGSLNGNSFIEL